MSDLRPIEIERYGDKAYVVDPWPPKVCVTLAWSLRSDIAEYSADRDTLRFTCANGTALYKREKEDALVWIGNLVSAEFNGPRPHLP